MIEPEIIPPAENSPSSAAAPVKPASEVGGVSEVPKSRRVKQGNNFFRWGLIGLAGAVMYYAYSAKVEDPLHLYIGLLMIVGAALPALMWAKRADFSFPVFEVFMLTNINTYAIPLLSGHQALQMYDSETITTAGFGVLLYQLVANLVYMSTKARPKKSPAWTEEVISKNVAKYLVYGMTITTIYTIVVQFFPEIIPRDLESILRAVCFGVGIMSTFIQSRMWGQGTLPPQDKAIFLFLLVCQVIFSWAALFLIGGLSILVLALLGYVSGGKKIPILPFIVVLPVVAILHNGKGDMREKYWEGGAPMPKLTELPAFYTEWFNRGLDPATTELKKQQHNQLLERTSLFHILCLVVSCSPDRQPYLGGTTYAQIPAQFIPSFFWPDKPPGHISTYTLSIYYGLQREEDTAKTTIAFGMLAEAYANFGYFGMAAIAALFAFCFKKFGCWAANSPLLSYPGLVLIVLMAWSFQAEFTLSIWLASFYQACVAVLGVPFLMRNFLGQ